MIISAWKNQLYRVEEKNAQYSVFRCHKVLSLLKPNNWYQRIPNLASNRQVKSHRYAGLTVRIGGDLIVDWDKNTHKLIWLNFHYLYNCEYLSMSEGSWLQESYKNFLIYYDWQNTKPVTMDEGTAIILYPKKHSVIQNLCVDSMASSLQRDIYLLT